MIKRNIFSLFCLVLFVSGLVLPALITHGTEPQGRNVLVVTVNGVINPVSSEFIRKSIDMANDEGYEALVIELDTPGGLMDSMRDIIKSMIGSDVPVVVYVAPGGARAASAGAFITIAAHVAAMAPQTNIGAAHPVGVGQDMDDTMAEKVTNDAVAYIRSLAEKRGRNADWAEDAVRKSISSTEQEALELGVIDVVSPNLSSLLEVIDGKKVETVIGERTLNTKGAEVKREEMSLRHKILDLISNPNIAYILMILGFYGLFFEMTNPGALFPGIMGGICLILAFYAFQTLPVNYAGLLLILLGIVLFILETQITSFGALTIGGIISMTLGSIMLFESGAPFMKLSINVIITTVGVTAAFFLVVIRLAIKAHKRKPSTGPEGLVGEEGIARADITPEGGQILLHGELWSAYADNHISKGEHIEVNEVNGLRVKVKKKV
jgi:membrane-bound serine protease (ClpP class)